MGQFGYICRGCKSYIAGDTFCGGEKVVLIHVRHGEEVGRVEGHYNSYGGVIEQGYLLEDEKYRGNNKSINGHEEICKSEFGLEDSYWKIVRMKDYKGKMVHSDDLAKELTREHFTSKEDTLNSEIFKNLPKELKETLTTLIEEDFEKNKSFVRKQIIRYLNKNFYNNKDIKTYVDSVFIKLKTAKLKKYSGTIAWHHKCYYDATERRRKNLTPSKDDPKQSWGDIRTHFC